MHNGKLAVDVGGEVIVTRSETVGASRIIVRLTGHPRPVFDAVVHDALDTPELVELLSAYVSARAASRAPQSVARRPLPLVPARPALRLLP